MFRKRPFIFPFAAALLGVALFARLMAAPPAWWSDSATRILDPAAPSANYAPANLGQLKNAATQAKKHLDEKLAPVGGAGQAINSLVAGFQKTTPDNYAPVNLGQTKAVAKPFYDRLIALGVDTRAGLIAHGYPANWPHAYPWNPNDPLNKPSPPGQPVDKTANYAPANLGQLKMTFSFNANQDTDTDGLPDWWETRYNLNPHNPTDALTLSPGGLSYLAAYGSGIDPNDPLQGASPAAPAGVHISFPDTALHPADPDLSQIRVEWNAPAESGVTATLGRTYAGDPGEVFAPVALASPTQSVPITGLLSKRIYQFRVTFTGANNKASSTDISYEVPVIRGLMHRRTLGEGMASNAVTFLFPGMRLYSNNTYTGVPRKFASYLRTWNYTTYAGDEYHYGSESLSYQFSSRNFSWTTENHTIYYTALGNEAGRDDVIYSLTGTEPAPGSPTGGATEASTSASTGSYASSTTRVLNFTLQPYSTLTASGAYAPLWPFLSINSGSKEYGDYYNVQTHTHYPWTKTPTLVSDASGQHLQWTGSDASYVGKVSYTPPTDFATHVPSGTTISNTGGSVSWTRPFSGSFSNSSETVTLTGEMSTQALVDASAPDTVSLGLIPWYIPYGTEAKKDFTNQYAIAGNGLYYTTEASPWLQWDYDSTYTSGTYGSSLAGYPQNGHVTVPVNFSAVVGQYLLESGESYGRLLSSEYKYRIYPPAEACTISWLEKFNPDVPSGTISTPEYKIRTYALTAGQTVMPDTDRIIVNRTEAWSVPSAPGASPQAASRRGTAYVGPLLPVEMMVDANRDGEMSFTDAAIHGKDGTTAAKPYRFWINDDHDQGHTVDGNDWEEDDINGAADNADNIITWRRDLEDFTRLWISFKGITEMVKQTGFQVKLEWKPTDGDTWTAADGNPGIRVFKAFEEQDGGRQYLEEETVAWQQLDGVQGPGNHNNFSQALGSNAGLVKGGIAGQTTVELPASFFTSLSESQPYKYLLFEGYSAGKGRLILTLHKGGQKIAEYPPVYLELLDIRDMYERYTVGNDNGGAPQENAAVLQTYNQATGYARAGHARPFAYADSDPEEKKYILYVHGWNMAPNEKDQFSATAYKRLFWQGYKGRFGIFNWPTTYGFGEAAGFDDSNPISNYIASGIDASADQTNYDRGEWSAWRSAPMLRGLLAQLNQKYPGQVNVLAHSMGNVVTGEALRLQTQQGGGQLVKTYVASQSAVPVHCYDSTVADNLLASRTILGIHFGGGAGGLETPNIYKDWLSGNAGAVGKRVKFYNVNDYALWEDAWQLNQWFKPDNRDLPQQPWWYHFTGNKSIAPPEDKFTQSNGPVILGGQTLALRLGNAAAVEDRYEIMAFAAESYSKPMGGMAGQTGFNIFVDLQSLWPPDAAGPQRPYSAHKWHSKQFRGTNMEQKNYWKKLVGPDAFDVVPQP